MQTPLDTIDTSHWGGHVLSLFATLGAVVGILPAFAAFAGLVWYCIQIWESQTFQKYLISRRASVAAAHLQFLHRQKRQLEKDLEELHAAMREANKDDPPTS